MNTDHEPHSFTLTLHRPQPLSLADSLTTATPYVFVTPTILALNILVFAAMVIAGVGLMNPDIHKMVSWGADYWPLTTTGQWWRLLTSAFLHFGLLHIALNMWALFSIGKLTERLYGNLSYALIYLFGALASGLASTWWDRNSVSAGASGAIFAVYGAFLAFLACQHRSFPKGAVTPLLKSALTFVAFNVFYGMTNPGISNSAHLGGLLSGFALGLILARPLESQPRARQRIPRLALALLTCALVLGSGLYFIPKYDRPNATLAQTNGQAVALWRKAADAGDPQAMFYLGAMYATGRGSPHDDPEAFKWYSKAAEAGNSSAMFYLAEMYADGRGTAKDQPLAVRWYRKAADAGDVSAMVSLGYLYENGQGVPPDPAQAMKWYRTASENGDSQATACLARLLYYQGNWQEAADNFASACQFTSSTDYDHMWLFLSSCRANHATDARTQLKAYLATRHPKDQPDWTGQLVAFLAGNLTEADLLKASQPSNPTTARQQLCEATFYAGSIRLIQGDRNAAAHLFTQCIATDVKDYIEYRAAQVELTRLSPKP